MIIKKVLKGCGIALAAILVLLVIAGIGIMIFIDRIFPDGSAETLPTSPTAGADSALVETTSGSVRGFVSGDIYTYYGIPYAQATERFTPAQPSHWDGVLDAVAYGPIAMQGGAPVYAYVYTWESPESGGRMLATHGAEIPFVFHNIAYSAMAGTSDEAKALEQAMSSAWLAFAHTGNPSTESLDTSFY